MDEVVTLYNSNVCRLCAVESENASLLYVSENDENDLSTNINKYLPIKIFDDGKLPRSICPGCCLQLEGTSQFFELIIQGQDTLRQLLQNENDTVRKYNAQETAADDILFNFNVGEDGSCYPPEHDLTIKISGNKPKKKRGRPPKLRTEEQDDQVLLDEDTLQQQDEDESIKAEVEEELDGEGRRKRKRKAPLRYNEAVQGKELERIYVEEGVIGEEEVDEDEYKDGGRTEDYDVQPDDKEIIGHLETKEGHDLGELVVANRNRNKQKTKVTRKKKFRYYCDICGRGFLQQARWQHHKTTHRDVQYECRECLERFRHIQELVEHYANTNHKEGGIIETLGNVSNENKEGDSAEREQEYILPENIYDINAEKEKETSTTIKLETESEGYEQTITKVNDNSSVKMSINYTNNEYEKFRCGECNKSFTSKQSLDIHFKAVHQNERPFTCEICEKSFAYQTSLKNHMLTHMEAKLTYPCDICHKVLNHPSSLNYHKDTEHNNDWRFVCNKCGKSFKHKQLLRRHQVVHTSDRPFPCKTCSAAFKTKANLLNHESTHTGIKKYPCTICDQNFAHKTSLTLHLRWHTGDKPFECSVCQKAFSQNGNLQEHMRIHTGDKPFACEHCDRRFTTSSQYRLHLRRHTGEKPWACTYCDKRFLHKDTWKCHLRRHQGDKPFKCSVCGRCFSEQWALKKHWRSHTGEKPHICQQCGKSFSDSSNLNKHRKTHKSEDVNVKEFPKLFIKLPKSHVGDIQGNNVWNMIQGHIKSVDGLSISNENIQNAEHQEIQVVTYEADAEHNDLQNAVYVTYDESKSGESNVPKVIQINDVRSLIKPMANPLKVEVIEESAETDETAETLNHGEFQVSDESGNALHLSVNEEQQFAISTESGESIQLTMDGRNIPVQLATEPGQALSEDLQMQIQRALQHQFEMNENGIGENSTDAQILSEDQTIEITTKDGQKLHFVTGYNEDLEKYYY